MNKLFLKFPDLIVIPQVNFDIYNINPIIAGTNIEFNSKYIQLYYQNYTNLVEKKIFAQTIEL